MLLDQVYQSSKAINCSSPDTRKIRSFKLYNNQSNKMNDSTPPKNNGKHEYSPFVIKTGYYSSISNKTTSLNNLTDKKRLILSNKVYSPSPNTSKTDKLSDRFIPMNKGINLMEKFNLAKRFESSQTDENIDSTNMDNYESENNVKFNQILMQNALNENINPCLFSNNNNTNIKNNIFSFKQESKPKTNFFESMLLSKSTSNDSNDGQNLRKINTKPYKILKAPNLIDDFYLNLVDWSSRNDIAVGLGNRVGLWCTNQTQESILSSYENEAEKFATSVIWDQSGEHLAVGNSFGQVEVYDVATHRLLFVFPGHEARVGVVAWNNNIISSGSKDCSIISRDVRVNNTMLSLDNFNLNTNNVPLPNTNNMVMKLNGHNQEVCGLKWSFDGTQLASGGNDNKLILWSLNSNKPLMVNCSHTAAVKAIAWSPHQHNILISGGGTADRTIRFWNTTMLTQTNKIDTGSQVCNLVFSKTVNEFVSTHGFSLNQIIVWKYPSLAKIATLTGHTYRVLYLGISPDGQNIVTGAGDETLRFWNIFPPYKYQSTSCLFPSNEDLR